MSSINTTARLLKRVALTNLFISGGIANTPRIVGTHGSGKTAICHQLAKMLNGQCLVVEGGSLKEGEITGLPFGFKNPDGTSEVRFIPYYQTAVIQRLERKYKEIAENKGFLNGAVRINEKGETIYNIKDYSGVLPKPNDVEQAILGEDNKYKFGEDLPADVKLKLLESGEIQPIVLLIDEMNRTDNQTMKELMNIVLTRTVNGYKFPWWVFVVSAINPCGQDSIYSTNEMDPAQLDRFLTIKVSANLEEWIDWAIENNIDEDYIVALSSSEEIFQTKGKGYEESDATDLTPSPRSHTLCSYIYNTKDKISQSKFFTAEEATYADEDVRALIIGKIGRRAGNTILAALRNRENYIDPKDILTGKDKVVNEKLLMKISGMKTIARRILMKNITKYIARTLAATYYDQNSKDSKISAPAKVKWSNIISQIKSLLAKLDKATQLVFAKDSLDTKLALSEEKYKKYNDKQNLFTLIGTTFALDIIQQVAMTNNAIENGDIDKK